MHWKLKSFPIPNSSCWNSDTSDGHIYGFRINFVNVEVSQTASWSHSKTASSHIPKDQTLTPTRWTQASTTITSPNLPVCGCSIMLKASGH
jgi:hypothetical protein